MIVASTFIIFLLLAFLFYASYSIRSGIYIQMFCKKRTTEKVTAITFDDGPDSIQTPLILKTLREYNVPACFFCIGSKIKGNEMLLRKMVQEGHILGNHSHIHSNLFPLYSFSRMKDELQTCQSALEQVTSQKITLFRPPFGVTNPTIARVIRVLGYTPVGWNIRTLDTRQHSPEKVIQRIRKRLCPGSVILLHDRMPDSDLLLKQILDLLKEQEYTVVRLDRMILK